MRRTNPTSPNCHAAILCGLPAHPATPLKQPPRLPLVTQPTEWATTSHPPVVPTCLMHASSCGNLGVTRDGDAGCRLVATHSTAHTLRKGTAITVLLCMLQRQGQEAAWGAMRRHNCTHAELLGTMCVTMASTSNVLCRKLTTTCSQGEAPYVVGLQACTACRDDRHACCNRHARRRHNVMTTGRPTADLTTDTRKRPLCCAACCKLRGELVARLH